MRNALFMLAFTTGLILTSSLPAQQNLPPLKPIARRIPPKGIKLSAADAASLTKQLNALEARFARIKRSLQNSKSKDMAADVEIYLKAVRFALLHGEFYGKGDVNKARQLLSSADARLKSLASRKAPWITKRGLVVRGYYSSVDQSAQPYGLVIPDKLNLAKPVPLYIWLHGRGDKTTDMHFIAQREKSTGQIKPSDAIVLHPFGRQCIGFKSAGEIGVLEAIDSVSKRYKIDPDRIVLMGFSMGGAGAWHIGAHYTDRFCAVHAGAGFTELRRYQNLDPKKIPEYERALWGIYDVPPYVRNLFNVPVVAYSGEKDKQKLAADIMAEAYQTEGKKLPHIIGPGMGHKYHSNSLKQVMAEMAKAVRSGRNKRPDSISLQTRTLRYNRYHWIRILALQEHWADARIDVAAKGSKYNVTTKNINAFRAQTRGATTTWTIDGSTVRARPHAGEVSFQRVNGKWQSGFNPAPLAKRHGLQGPIDDAFMEPFLVVTPSGQSGNPLFDRWVQFEIKHLQDRWQSLFRGDLPTKKDSQVTASDLQKFHIVAFGDAASNKLISRILNQKSPALPLKWQKSALEFAGRKYDAKTHVPLMIYPNPLNPDKYLVMNSGPTFRESHDRTNSLQNPKLGDWAIIDISSSPDNVTPGKIVAAGFFNELWKHSK